MRVKKQPRVPTLVNFTEADRFMLDAIVTATKMSMSDVLRQLVAKRYATLRKWGKIGADDEESVASRV